jgi:L-2-hydroxyglutarate oxidase LhgO
LDHVECSVIGGGVVGLAIGRALAAARGEVFVLEREAEFGQGVSSRNSEVIHAGIYYPRDSLKARLCVQGKEKLYAYCRDHHVGHARCGKVIVATAADEESVLEDIVAKATANGVDDVVHWSAAQVQAAEPHVRAVAALFSPSTGIVSSHELMQAYLSDMERDGGAFIGHTRVLEVHREGELFLLVCDVGGESYRFTTRILVNAAGLGAQAVAGKCSFLDPACIPALYLCKGNYFTLQGRSPFKHLIYPVPEKSGAGLGVHATIDLGGQAKFGPDVEYIEAEDYGVNTTRLDAYYEAVRRYYPALADGALTPGYVGIRPKLQGPGDPVRDFVIQGEDEHGIPGLVQLFGIESPGLTSSMAIADYALNLIRVT